MDINGQPCRHEFRELKRTPSREGYRRSGKMRHGDRRKWNHQQTESRKTVEEKANVTPELKPTLEREEK